ncbi:hypothetical protein K435DRAFT_106642 [Dendrothele bispora CBS 962.96]|uniref:Cyclin N-terminal domain-containing protein n=1 Tax=Dendrothele bispora (strain CBS 962.96) TaxID=1314807 RepID=A0A4S8MQW9_DENBC|nr:hypothetical protein K435DRAFT_106642 [Dendrothele bispora CBS 962.96]
MPVPVPCLPKQPAHPVIKAHHTDNTNKGENLSFHGLTLPVSPTGPPPSFGTREQWINSLPSWRRSPEQGFHQGLAGAVNAPVIKGAPADACIPPLSDVDMHISSDYPTDFGGNTTYSKRNSLNVVYDHQTRGAFSPIFEDQSPAARSEQDLSSSPIEPITPFGDFVDRAVATSQHNVSERGGYGGLTQIPFHHQQQQQSVTQPGVELPKEPVPAPASAPELMTPTATSGYRKLSEPLSEWIANFVWKACTTGLNLPARPIHNMSKTYSASPPGYLATSVHSLLLSTLLQPSAIFLSLWYIVRLPVYFGTVGLNAEHVKELRFRVALLGDQDRETMENHAPFRLVVLGCMLANKWLDDHTFSNKNWHSISNVPIQLLNKLESLALDIFSYDLSVSSSDWSQWMSQVLSYHLSLSSPCFPQPISRPSSSPHYIIRLAIEEIIQAPAAASFDASNPQPVFLGLEERKKRLAKEQALNADVLEIDLDEDGPLREEYMPRRRISGSASAHSASSENHPPRQQNWEADRNAIERCLPPPAKWSPAADEPILRENNRAYGRYVAVQPTPAHSVPAYHMLPMYQPTHEVAVYGSQPWLTHGNYTTVKHPPYMAPAFDFSAVHRPPPPPAYNPLLFPFVLSHSRSDSYSHDQDTSQSSNHMRSYSQSQYEYRSSGLRMTANELTSVHNETWGPAGHYTYPAPAFVPHPSVSYQSAWLRT